MPMSGGRRRWQGGAAPEFVAHHGEERTLRAAVIADAAAADAELTSFQYQVWTVGSAAPSAALSSLKTNRHEQVKSRGRKEG